MKAILIITPNESKANEIMASIDGDKLRKILKKHNLKYKDEIDDFFKNHSEGKGIAKIAKQIKDGD